MLSTMLKYAGYTTGMSDTWHLGGNDPYGPEYRRFVEVLRHYGGAVGVLADYWDNCYVDDTYYHNGVPTKVKGYCRDVFFSAATRFIGRSAERDEPFSVHLATNAPHGPKTCAPKYSEPYAEGMTQGAASFYGMTAKVGENVERLRAFLEEKGLERNTIFIFATDNGTAGGQAIFNAKMRGNKGSAYDGGHRVPLILHWPDGGFAGEWRIHTLTAHIDIVPTLLDLCGIEPPEDAAFDGVSLRRLLETGDHPEWLDRIIMTDSQGQELPKKWGRQTAVLSEQWRLVGGAELYDIDADPGQKTNIYTEYPDVVEGLSCYYDTLWEEIEPTLKDVAGIPLGDPRAKTVMLNYHMIVLAGTSSGFRMIFAGSKARLTHRAANVIRHFWPVNVVAVGEYTIGLRRWPKELNAAIRAGIPPGTHVYGRPSHRSEPGAGFLLVRAQLNIGKQQIEKAVRKDSTAATFTVRLPAGSRRLSARFIDARGKITRHLLRLCEEVGLSPLPPQ